MNWLAVLAVVTIICLLNRGSCDRRYSPRNKGDMPRQRDDQIDRLHARISVLEEILLDRERRLRDDFRGLG
ncbi:MAG: hypothetical protein AAGK23_06610 [Pseudomonadota bacterium]